MIPESDLLDGSVTGSFSNRLETVGREADRFWSKPEIAVLLQRNRPAAYSEKMPHEKVLRGAFDPH